MNPSNEPFDPTKNQTPPSTPPANPSASDAAAMQAIEALEAESNGLPEAEPVTPQPSALPSTPPEVAPTPIAPIPPLTTESPTTPAVPLSSPEDPAVPASDAPSGVAADLNKSLSEEAPVASTASEFQPFAAKKKSSKKSIIILVIIIAVLILGAGGYFGWQYLQSQNTPTTPVQTTPDTSTEQETIPGDTETSVTEMVTDIETQLDGIDDSEYDDTTLDDSTLYN
ncbi:MAG: hypothetical protein WAV04_02765 [Candidatus Microsaccharimonas sp.]